MARESVVTPAIQKLIKTYQVSQQNIINMITIKELKGNSTWYAKNLLLSVTQELDLLDKFTLKWMNEEIPKAYGLGIDTAYQAFRDAGLDVAKVQASQKVVKLLVDNAVGNLQDATQYVGRRIQDDLRQAGLDAIAQKLSSGETVRATQANLMKMMSDKGIVAIVDKNGRNINLDSYAAMVSRSTTAEATNTGTIQETTDLGNDLMQITTTFTTCALCAQYEGKIYSVSGKDKRYPKLSEAFSSGFNTIHPNCTHRITSYWEKLDENAKENRAMSNKPFEAKDKKASIDRYNAQQADKAVRRQDRSNWESDRLNKPDETAKSFSAYRAKLNKERVATMVDMKPDVIRTPKYKAEPIIKQHIETNLTEDFISKIDEGENTWWRWQDKEYEVGDKSWGMVYGSEKEARQAYKDLGLNPDDAILQGKSAMDTFDGVMNFSTSFDDHHVLLAFEGSDTLAVGHDNEFVVNYVKTLGSFKYDDAIKMAEKRYQESVKSIKIKKIPKFEKILKELKTRALIVEYDNYNDEKFKLMGRYWQDWYKYYLEKYGRYSIK